MKTFLLILAAPFLGVTAAMAHEGMVTPLFAADIPEMPGKEIVLISVDYEAGDETPTHRHDAHAVVYVLEGAVIMQVEGQEPQTVTTGETFSEKPDDIHLVSRNASDTDPAKFLVFLLKDKDNSIVAPSN
ncbi:cupin domain-containing protein [Paracoccus caeni]|uniref:Cupin domain-containing protein n=1 Tax=Paracoccus caeni TaxID=657651 RepID=A0A934SGX9_9RHOB|nr:cupin domain-containing protein [Paracoccus caeni]MBK4217647.1 cupin domain-containing protein [Paracoccus caeni]